MTASFEIPRLVAKDWLALFKFVHRGGGTNFKAPFALEKYSKGEKIPWRKGDFEETWISLLFSNIFPRDLVVRSFFLFVL